MHLHLLLIDVSTIPPAVATPSGPISKLSNGPSSNPARSNPGSNLKSTPVILFLGYSIP